MFPVSNRKLELLRIVRRYGRMTRAQIQRKLGVRNDRVVRALCQELVAANLLGKTRHQVVNPIAGAPAPVYYPTRQGAETVAAYFDDPLLLHAAIRPPGIHTLFHTVHITDFLMTLDDAITGQAEVALGGMFAEWDEVNPDAERPEQRYRLFTLIRETPKRLVAIPDCAFQISVGSFTKLYYGEIDLGTSGVAAASASKSPGYAALQMEGLFRRHAVTAESFSVLHLSPTPGRRDLMRRAFSTKEGAALHRFACLRDWTPEKALFEPIFFTCEGDEPQPLIRSASRGAA